MQFFLSQNPTSAFYFKSCLRRPNNLFSNGADIELNSKPLREISSRKVSLCLSPSITQLNVRAWLSIVVVSSRKISLWVTMSFSKAETLERICSMVSVLFSKSASSRARVDRLPGARVGVQWTLGAVHFRSAGSEGRSAVHFRSPGFGVRSAVDFRNPSGIRTGELTDQSWVERHPYHWTTQADKTLILWFALVVDERATLLGEGASLKLEW